MADELKLKIVLDDGSVKEGFLSVEKQADKTAKKIEQSFDKKESGLQKLSKGADGLSDALESVSGGTASVAARIAGMLGPVGALALAVGAVAGAYGKMVLAGEQVNAINTQFDRIAQSAGLSVDSFKNSIIEATKGLIDDEDALQIATKGIIALGTEAQRLPQILDASRTVSKALGKDFKESFQDLSTFVEFGNARVLRNYGIVLDLDKAYEKAAKSIGLTAAQLTEQQKQTIRANELLDQIPKKFDAAAESVTPFKDAFNRLKVSAGNALDEVLTKITDISTKAFFGNAGLSVDKLKTSLAEVSKQIESANARIAEIKLDKLGSKSVQASAEVASLNSYIKELRKELNSIQSEIDKREKKKTDSAAEPEAKKSAISITPEQSKLAREAELKRLNDLQAYISQQDKLIVDSEIKRLQTITDIDQKLTAQKSVFDQQSILLEQQKNTALSQIDTQFSAEKGFSESQREQARLATIQNFYLQEQELARQNAEKIKEIEANKNFDIQTGFSSFADGFSQAALDFRNNAVANFKEVGKQAFNSLGRAVGQAFAAFGQALASGEDAGQAFVKSMLGVFADIAIQLGTSYILQGIAASANPLTPGMGAPLITAGAALATFGGILKGLSGGKSQTTQQETGGGIAASPSTTTELTPTENLQRQEPQTAVSVTIQGDVLDSDESGSRIVSLINQAFDKKGVVINQGVMA